MNFFVAIVLGIVQGITEFLPISSSGHLVLLEHIFSVEFDYTFLNVVLHFATLLAVCWFYRKQLLNLIKHPFSKDMQFLILATIPAVLFVVLCNNFVENNLNSLLFVGIGFLSTSILLLTAYFINKNLKQTQNLSYKHACIMGIAQAFAIFPGLSRSGTTLSFGLVSGLEKKKALDFSFLMSVPIILGSLIYELVTKNISFSSFTATDIIPIALSFVSAVIFAIISIKFMNKIIEKMKLWYFVPYLLIIGTICLFLK